MFNTLRKSVEGLLDEIISIAYFMRGAIQYDDLWFRTPVERQKMSDFIEKRLELESKSSNPVY